MWSAKGPTEWRFKNCYFGDILSFLFNIHPVFPSDEGFKKNFQTHSCFFPPGFSWTDCLFSDWISWGVRGQGSSVAFLSCLNIYQHTVAMADTLVNKRELGRGLTHLLLEKKTSFSIYFWIRVIHSPSCLAIILSLKVSQRLYLPVPPGQKCMEGLICPLGSPCQQC